LKIPGKRNTRGIVYKFLDEVLVECITRLKSMGRLGGVQVHRWRRWRIRISENYLRDCTIFDDMEINEAGQVHNSCLHPVCILCTIISSIHPAKPSIIPLIWLDQATLPIRKQCLIIAQAGYVKREQKPMNKGMCVDRGPWSVIKILSCGVVSPTQKTSPPAKYGALTAK